MHVRTSGIIYRTSSSLIPRIVIARPPVIVSLLTSPVALKHLSLYICILRMNKILYASTIGGYATLPLSIYPMDASVWVAFYLASSIICPSVRPHVYVPWPVWLLYCFFVVRGMIKNLLQMLHERIYYVSGDLQSMLHLALEYFLRFFFLNSLSIFKKKSNPYIHFHGHDFFY